MKQLSVIVPCYNVEGYLVRCLDSLVHQNIAADAYEVLLIDDGSTDGTGAICDRYATQYPQVQAIHQANAGQGAARNAGLDLAQGEYIFFVDSDDFVVENCFSKLLHITESNALDVLMFDYTEVAPQSEVVPVEIDDKQKVDIITGDQLLSISVPAGCVWQYLISHILIQREKLRFSDRLMGEDTPFIYDALLSSKRIVKLRDSYYFYVQRVSSIMHEQDLEHKVEVLKNFTYISISLGKVLEKHSGHISEATRSRVEIRCIEFANCGLVKALRAGVVADVYRLLKENGKFPLARLSKDEYPGIQWTLAYFLFKSEKLTLAVGKLVSFLGIGRSKV